MTERIVATYRAETDYCEKGTQGCCIDHTAEDGLGQARYDLSGTREGSCETW